MTDYNKALKIALSIKNGILLIEWDEDIQKWTLDDKSYKELIELSEYVINDLMK